MQTKNTEHVEEQLEEEHAYELCTQKGGNLISWKILVKSEEY